MSAPVSGQRPERTRYDVIIVGGAMLGSSVAWFLATDPDFDGRVLVVERDPSYRHSSTAHTNSCMRQQFSSEINVRISQFAADFVKNLRRYHGDDERVPEITFDSYGYLYLADSATFADALRAACTVQNRCGAATRHLIREEVARDYPFFRLDDIVAANHNRVDEGYFDGNTVFDWWRRGAREHGVEYLADEVVGVHRNAAEDRIEGVTLASGERIACGTLVNASGPRAALTARLTGIDVPVEPRKRYTFVFEAERPLDRALPLTIDPSGVHVRSDALIGRRTYLAGCPPDDDPAVDPDDFVQDHSLWEEKVWPALANRIPQFEAIRLINGWVGHYAYNTLDQNAIVGPHPRLVNFLFVNGFSGHGFQQSPAMGRGISELIVHGAYRTLDLSPFGYERVVRGEPFVEQAVI